MCWKFAQYVVWLAIVMTGPLVSCPDPTLAHMNESMESHDHEQQVINRMPAPDVISLCLVTPTAADRPLHTGTITMATSEPAQGRQKSREGLDLKLTERSAKPKPSTSAASKSSRPDQNLAIPSHSKNKSSLRIRSSSLAIKRIACWERFRTAAMYWSRWD